MALKEQVFEMHNVIDDMVECIDSLYTGFIYNNLMLIGEAESVVESAGSRTAALTEGLAGEAGAEPYVSVPSHIAQMAEGLGRVVPSLKSKIKEDVLFSDRAMAELDYMFERTRDILISTRDLVLARNVLISRHVEEAQRAVEKMADTYATRYEDSLVGGLSTPRSSQLYIRMLDAFKVISWHAKEIAKDLAG